MGIDAAAWALIGQENLQVAAQLCVAQAWRSCISRAYYSAFATAHVSGDRSPLNPTYNKYEQRFGNGHAEIVDYLIVEGDRPWRDAQARRGAGPPPPPLTYRRSYSARMSGFISVRYASVSCAARVAAIS